MFLDSVAHFQKGYTGDTLFLLHNVLSLGREDKKSSVAWCWNNPEIILSGLVWAR